MLIQKHHYKEQLARELYLFTIFSLIGGTVYGLYYGIFLYRHSFDIKVLVIDSLIVALTAWIGYMIGTFWIHKSGYLPVIKTSFLLLAITALATLLLIESIRSVYPLLSALRGLPAGMFSAVIDIYLLKEMTSRVRGSYLSMRLSLEFIIAVILPFLIGGLISVSNSYKPVFVLAALINLAAFLWPVRYNKHPASKISLNDEIALLSRPGMREYNFNTVLTSGADQLNVLLIAIVPFLIFNSELKVGSFLGIVGIIAAAISLIVRKVNFKSQIKIGYLGNIGRLVSNIALAILWSPLGLFIQGILNKAMSPLNDPVFQRIRINNAANILGDELNTRALEMDLMNATMVLFGECIALASFLFILAVQSTNQSSALRYLLVVYGAWKLFNYIWVVRMKRRLEAPRLHELQ